MFPYLEYALTPHLVAWLYGLELGIGFTTFIAVATVYVVATGAMLSGNPVYAALLFACFGAARGGFLALIVRNIQNLEQSYQISGQMAFVSQQVHVVNGIALAGSGILFLVIAINLQ